MTVTNNFSGFTGLKHRGIALSVGAGGIMFFLYPILGFSALRIIPASVNAILVATSTIFVAIIAMITLKEKLNPQSYLGITLAFVGVPMIILSSGGLFDIKSINLFGCLLALLGAIASASYIVLGRAMMQKYDALTVTLIASLSGTALQTITTSLFIGFKEIFTVSLTTLLLILYWGVFSGLGYFFFYKCMERLEATRTSSFIYFAPLFAILLSVIILHETVGILFFVGMALIFSGVRLAQKR
jgi:drug/metabolite transporter (DMT)-like permease